MITVPGREWGHVGRTCSLPAQGSRTHGIRRKLSVVRQAVAGRSVLFGDDAIVRGNTSREIVGMAREAGARAVRMRLASPPSAWPGHLGSDTPSREELITNRHASVAEAERSPGADNLRHLSLDGLGRATGGGRFCFGCTNGAWPT